MMKFCFQKQNKTSILLKRYIKFSDKASQFLTKPLLNICWWWGGNHLLSPHRYCLYLSVLLLFLHLYIDISLCMILRGGAYKCNSPRWVGGGFPTGGLFATISYTHVCKNYHTFSDNSKKFPRQVGVALVPLGPFSLPGATPDDIYLKYIH